MSQRELRALLTDQRGSTAYCNLPQEGTKSRSQVQLQPAGGIMTEEEEAGANIMADRLQELERRLEMAETENKRKEEELRRSYQELQEAGEEIQSYQTQVDRYAAEMERVKLQCELEKHRALESLREEHAGQLKFLQSQTERERERTDSWIAELKERVERENQGYKERIEALEGELYQQRAYAKPCDPYSCFDSECDTNSGLQHPAGSHVDPCPADVLHASGVQTISSERESQPIFGNMPSQTIVSQISESGPVYSFSQEYGASVLKGYTGEPKQPKVTHAHVQFTGAHEQEFQDSVQGHRAM